MESYKERMMEGITENLIAFSLGKRTDMNSICVKELEEIFESTEAMNSMQVFYYDLCRMDGFAVTHKRQEKFVDQYPATAKLLTIFIYS